MKHHHLAYILPFSLCEKPRRIVTQRIVSHAFTEVLRQYCIERKKPYVVTPSQWGVLSLLYEHDGITIGSISQRRGFDAPTMTGIVKRLEQSGLVKRCHSREDRRVIEVYLTDEVRDCMSFLPGAAESFYEILVKNLSVAEQNDFCAKLHQLIENVAAVASGTGDRFGLLPQKFLDITPE